MRLALILLLVGTAAGTASAQYGDSPMEGIERELRGIRDDNFFWNIMNMPSHSGGAYGGGYSGSIGSVIPSGGVADPGGYMVYKGFYGGSHQYVFQSYAEMRAKAASKQAKAEAKRAKLAARRAAYKGSHP
jgi:hypothetical protein